MIQFSTSGSAEDVEGGEEDDGEAGDGGAEVGFAEQQGTQYPAILALAVSPTGFATSL